MKKEKLKEAVMENKGVLTYYLTVEEGSRGNKLYGIALEKRCAGEITEKEWTGAISASRENVCKLLRRMADCMVTPDVLLEVTDDWGELYIV